jgi:hypothetical protein
MAGTSERKSPPGPREIIQELDHTATFYPLGFEEETPPTEIEDDSGLVSYQGVGGDPEA